MGKSGRIQNPTTKRKARRGDRGTVKWLTKDEVRRLFRAIPRENIRDRLLFNLMYLHGLRRTEAAQLKVNDLQNGTIHIWRLKGGESKTYRMFSSSRRLFRQYLAIRGDDPCPYLFRGRRHKCAPLSGRTLAALMGHYATIAGLPPDRRNCHRLRHSIGRHMQEEGFDISDVGDHLGHADLKSTKIYFQISDRRRERNHRRMRRSREIVRDT